MKNVILIGCLALSATGSALSDGAEPAGVAGQVRQWRVSHEQEIIDDFRKLLAQPNVATRPEDIRANAEQVADLFRQAGMRADILEAEGSAPAVFAERAAPGAARTVLVYMHMDGQPVAPEEWASDPWQAELRDAPVELGGSPLPMTAPFDPEARLFARSAADDKAPAIALRAALQALDAAGLAPSVNLKVFVDGEEEAGSPGLRAMLETHRERLGSDLWLFCDGPLHQSRRPTLVYGVRGVTGFNLTVYGANRPLHSGHYGNWAPNPILLLTGLIQSMRDLSGRITISGMEEQVRPVTRAEHAAVMAAPSVDDELMRSLGIARPETEQRIEEAILRPALNLRGIRSGGVGEQARNAIQPTATAAIGLRLVPDQTPEHLRGLIEAHIARQGFQVIHGEPTEEDRNGHLPLARLEWEEGYPAYRTPMTHPLAQRVSELLNAWSGGKLVQLPSMGGSLPIYVIDEVLKTPVLILPIANHDNNQHGANENLRIGNLWDAIETYAVVLTGL